MLILFTFLCTAVRNFPSQRRALTTCNKQHTAYKKHQNTQVTMKEYVDNSVVEQHFIQYSVKLSPHTTKPRCTKLHCISLYQTIHYTTHNETTLYSSYKVEAVISVVSFLMPHVTTGTAERPELLRARNRFRR